MVKYSERPNATTMTLMTKYVGLKLLGVAAVNLEAKALPPQTNRHRMTYRKLARGENTRSSPSCKYTELQCALNTPLIINAAQ